VYVVDSGIGEISGYSIDATTGALTDISGSPFNLGLVGGGMPQAIALDTGDKLAYVSGGGVIVAFTMDATTGALVLIPGGLTTLTASGVILSMAIVSIQ
jgi:6-phosphogluconolactonase